MAKINYYLLLLIFTINVCSCAEKENDNDIQNDVNIKKEERSNFQIGKESFEAGNFDASLYYLNSVAIGDSNYNIAQELLDSANILVKRKEEQAKIRNRLADSILAETRLKQAEITLRQADFNRDLDIIKSAWSKKDYLGVHWTVRIKNKSKYLSYKDIKLRMAYYGNSGTKIYDSIMGHTEYIIIRPGQTKAIEYDDIMAPKQSEEAAVYIDEALPQ